LIRNIRFVTSVFWLVRSFGIYSRDHIYTRTTFCHNGLHYNARQEEEAKDLLKRFKEHLSKARLERNYYNKNTKLAEEQRKLVNQNYSKGKTQYCSINATAHYSYD
jgi:hypothetical protein